MNGTLIILQDAALRHAMSELRVLLERFANSQSMDGMFDAANALIDDARRDPEFKEWCKRLNMYIHKVGQLVYYLYRISSSSIGFIGCRICS